MRANKIEKLESLKSGLQECLDEIEAVVMRADEDSIISMMGAVDEIELALKEAKNVVAEGERYNHLHHHAKGVPSTKMATLFFMPDSELKR